jgi:hypothetical protein
MTKQRKLRRRREQRRRRRRKAWREHRGSGKKNSTRESGKSPSIPLKRLYLFSSTLTNSSKKKLS